LLLSAQPLLDSIIGKFSNQQNLARKFSLAFFGTNVSYSSLVGGVPLLCLWSFVVLP